MVIIVSLLFPRLFVVQGWLSGANPSPTVVVGVDPALVTTSIATLKEALSRNLQGPLAHLQLYSESIYKQEA